MKTIEDKAKEYAQEVLKDQLAAVANAYIQGYNDAMASQNHEPIKEGKDRFVDLGLDSGTLWTYRPHYKMGHFQSVGFHEAINYGIPTKEQFEEMLTRCRYHKDYEFVGPSSESVYFVFTGSSHKRVWIKSDVVNDEALTCRLHSDGSYEFERLFVGERLRIMRVKNKNEE